MVFGEHMLVRGVPHTDSSYIFFKFALQNEEEKDRNQDYFKEIVRNMIQVYSFVTNVRLEFPSNWVMSQITSENPFGNPKWLPEFRLVPVIAEEQREKNVLIIRRALAKYELLKSIFQDKKRAFLRNAIDYYHRSLGDLRLEEKLIDLMISLESLFGETQELRLRISLRVSSILSVEQESEMPAIFTTIYRLYEKRSKVVHGTQAVDLDEFEVSKLRKYVRESIQRFVCIEKPKKDVLKLIDESVYDAKKREKLNQIVLEAIGKW